MELKDSGTRRKFESGAVRDVAEGKGRCDLLPLSQVAVILDNDTVIALISEFCKSGNIRAIYQAVRAFVKTNYPGPYTAILELAKHYEDGSRKYGDRNWERGIPCHCYVDSGIRHYLKFRRGDDDEPHDRAFIWNMLGLIWTLENHPECNDLPFNTESTQNL